MTQPNFDYEKYTDVFKKFQEPMQALADLNIKTMQGFQFMKPEDLSKINKPEELMQKQLEMALDNGHKALEYMQKSFQIIEKTMLSCMKEVKNTQKT